MSRAVLLKTLREDWLLILVVLVSIVLFEVVVVRMLIEAARDLELLRTWLERPLIKTLMRLALGDDLSGEITSTSLATFGLAHPFLYAVTWALLLAMATGAVAGEIGRGTADLLLALPLSRAAVYVSTSLVWLVAAILCSFVPLVGLSIGQRVFPLAEPLDLARLALVATNLCALNVAIAAFTLLVSSLVSRRGLAVGVVLAVLLVSDVVNLVASFWEAVEPISFLGFLHYYQPLPIVRSGQLPPGNLAVLLAIAAVTWSFGLWHFARRDIPAV